MYTVRVMISSNNKNAKPFFSVIIPTYNRDQFIQKAVDSVLNQSFDNFELIVIDDGSEDQTQQVLSKYSDQRLKCFKQQNQGVASARNRGLELARGNWICFLDSDDWWVNHKLERTFKEIKTNPKIKIFHTDEIWYKNGTLHNQKNIHKKPSGFVYDHALPLCCISISTVAIHHTVFDVIGIFDESMEACEDYDFWLRTTSKFEVKLIPEELTLKDGGRPDQLSLSVWGLDRFRIQALIKSLESDHISGGQYKATYNELVKKCQVYTLGVKKRGRSKEVTYYNSLLTKYKKA